MPKFAVGDWVVCKDFNGGSGLKLKAYEGIPLKISLIELDCKDHKYDLITVNGIRCYAIRFELVSRPSEMDDTEYNDIIASQEAMEKAR